MEGWGVGCLLLHLLQHIKTHHNTSNGRRGGLHARNVRMGQGETGSGWSLAGSLLVLVKGSVWVMPSTLPCGERLTQWLEGKNDTWHGVVRMKHCHL